MRPAVNGTIVNRIEQIERAAADCQHRESANAAGCLELPREKKSSKASPRNRLIPSKTATPSVRAVNHRNVELSE